MYVLHTFNRSCCARIGRVDYADIVLRTPGLSSNTSYALRMRTERIWLFKRPNETCDGKISDNLPNADIRTTQIQYGVRSTSINSQLWIAVDKETGVSFLFPHAVTNTCAWLVGYRRCLHTVLSSPYDFFNYVLVISSSPQWHQRARSMPENLILNWLDCAGMTAWKVQFRDPGRHGTGRSNRREASADPTR